MKRLSVIALLAVSFAFAGCKKENKDNKPAAAPAAGSAAAPAAGSAAAPAAGGAAAAAPAAGSAAAPADPVAPAPAAGGAAMSDAEFEATMKTLVDMLGQIASAFEAAGGDCAKGAEGLEKVLADNQAFIDKMKSYKDNAEMTKKAEEWMQGHMGEVMGPAMKMAELGQKCATDAKFAEAMKKMESLGK